MDDGHFELLGWHAPGEVPTVRSSSSRSEWIVDATSFHEQVHFGLTNASSHGQAQLALALMVDGCHPMSRRRVLDCIDLLNDSSRLVHEGCATFIEWLFLSSEHPGHVEHRLNTLPLEYRVAMDLFSWIVTGREMQGHVGVVQRVSTALALACMNTSIFDGAAEGLINVIETQLVVDPALRPNDRLLQIAYLPREDLWTLVPFVEERLVTVFRGVHHPLDERAALVVDRAVESWIKSRKLFEIGERLAHQHRQPLVEAVVSATAEHLGIQWHLTSIDRASTLAFAERIVSQDFTAVRSAGVYNLKDAESFSDALDVLEQSEDEELLYSRALVRGPVWPNTHNELTTFLTGMSIDQSSGDGSKVAMVSRPDLCVNLSRPFRFNTGLEARLSKAPITLTLGHYINLSRDQRRYLARSASHVFAYNEEFGEFLLRSVADEFGAITRLEHFKVPFIGARLVVVEAKNENAQFISFASSVGIREVKRRVAAEAPDLVWTEGAMLPIDYYLGAWPCLYGILRPDDLPVRDR